MKLTPQVAINTLLEAELRLTYRQQIRRFFNGMALETALAGLKFLFTIFIAISDGDFHIMALVDLRGWYFTNPEMALPFFIIGCMQAVGIYMNGFGYENSWRLRQRGAFLSMLLWFWLILKSIWIDALITGIVPFCIMAFCGSFFIMLKAHDRIPTPGGLIRRSVAQ